MKPFDFSISRRALLQGVAGTAVLALPGRLFAQAKTVVVAVWGGASSDAMKKIYGEAFTAGDIATLDFDESGPEPAKIRAMVEAGQVT